MTYEVIKIELYADARKSRLVIILNIIILLR